MVLDMFLLYNLTEFPSCACLLPVEGVCALREFFLAFAQAGAGLQSNGIDWRVAIHQLGELAPRRHDRAAQLGFLAQVSLLPRFEPSAKSHGVGSALGVAHDLAVAMPWFTSTTPSSAM